MQSSALKASCVRSDQYNTNICSLDDRYCGVFGERVVVFMNEEDMVERTVEPDSSGRAGIFGRRGYTPHPHNIPRGSIASYYPETKDLTPLSYHDPKSKMPSAKSVPALVRLLARSRAA